MDDDHAGVGAHQAVAVEEHGDGGVDAQLGESVGQQEGQHEELPAPVFKPGDGVSGGDAQHHGHRRGDNGHDEGLHDGGNQAVLREHIAPPLKAPLLGKDRGSGVLVCEG